MSPWQWLLLYVVVDVITRPLQRRSATAGKRAAEAVIRAVKGQREEA